MTFNAEALARAYAVGASDYGDKFGNDLGESGFDRSVLTSLLSDLRAGGAVLDCGCGPAQVARLATSVGVAAIGLDLTPEMLELGRARFDGSLVLGDMRDLPFAGASLSAVVCWYSVHNFPRELLPGVLDEFARVTQYGGLLALATHGGAGEVRYDDTVITYYEPSELTRLLCAAGFEGVVARTRPSRPDEHAQQKVIVSGRRARSQVAAPRASPSR